MAFIPVPYPARPIKCLEKRETLLYLKVQQPILILPLYLPYLLTVVGEISTIKKEWLDLSDQPLPNCNLTETQQWKYIYQQRT
jgi:hypothetical protein